MKGKILPNAKKMVDFNIYSLMMEILGKLGLKGNFFNLEKDFCQNLHQTAYSVVKL